jgi:two-component system response regulator FixJ
MPTPIHPYAAARSIAIVDPDPAVRHSLEFALQTEGYDVVSFAQGKDLLADMRENLRCVISEYRLADMTGLDLIGKVREIQHDASFVLLVTCPDRVLQRRALAEKVTIVEKPLVGSKLTDELRQITKSV